MPSLEELEARLRAANDAYSAQLKRPYDREAWKSLQSACHEAEAALFAAKGEPYARAIDIGINCHWEGPRLLQSTRVCLLVVGAFKPGPEGITDRGYAVLEFARSCWTTFGYPNDEAMEGHPLSGRGLDSSTVCEVFNSAWAERMRTQNRVAFPSHEMCPVRHFIFPFHEETFECLCSGVEVVFTHPEFETTMAHAASLVAKG
ncbi:MAG: hypothetical protein ACO1TE_00650 [Prosthecobacter sp.]